jgi:hypothetical protein
VAGRASRHRFLPIPASRYAAITFYCPSTRLPQILFAIVPGEIDNSLTNPYRVINPFYLDRRKQAYPSASLFYLDDKFVPPGQTLNLYFTRLAPLACIWQFTVLYFEIYKTGSMSTICKRACAPASLLSSLHSGTAELSVTAANTLVQAISLSQFLLLTKTIIS